MWLIIPLIYFLGWWQTGSLRQAFNATIAWIIAFSAVALLLLALDVGGFSGMTATPDSPAAAIAILGGFIGMWISNYIWRRRGGDPPRKHGKWERSFRAMLGMNGKKKKAKPKSRPVSQGMPQQQAPPPPLPQQQPSGPVPVDAQYRPIQPAQQPPPPTQQPQQPAFQQAPAPVQQFQQNPAPPPQANPPQPKPAPVQKDDRRSPTADKYAKATGRALGAMFRGPSKKKSKKSPNR